MNIVVKSKIEAHKYTFKNDITDDFVVISITDKVSPNNVFNTENNHLKGILFVKFTDLEESADTYKLISIEDGVAIREFVNLYKEKVSTIIVHCEAGISRSSGVAAALCRYLGEDEMQIFKNHRYSPNMLCYKTVLNACGIEITKEETEKLREVSKKAFDDYYETSENRDIINRMLGITNKEGD